MAAPTRVGLALALEVAMPVAVIPLTAPLVRDHRQSLSRGRWLRAQAAVPPAPIPRPETRSSAGIRRREAPIAVLADHDDPGIAGQRLRAIREPAERHIHGAGDAAAAVLPFLPDIHEGTPSPRNRASSSSTSISGVAG